MFKKTRITRMAAKVTTYVEMRDPAQLVPAKPSPLAVQLQKLSAPHDRQQIQALLREVGGSYDWPAGRRTDEEWNAWFEKNHLEFWMILVAGEPGGVAFMEIHPERTVEIRSFGLRPRFVGRGIGGEALTKAVQTAWAHEHPDGPTQRVWLHTSNNDHPNALPNYQRRGFSIFKVEEEEGDTKVP
jgi:GNAT superfamily N-acetyltransferase